ncbi:MAG: hypothetical protein KBC22_00130 [Candidatus Pacebacteria bacterium]|nr:hypothetical protein [Candidatus Paceibacterota bacterium]
MQKNIIYILVGLVVVLAVIFLINSKNNNINNDIRYVDQTEQSVSNDKNYDQDEDNVIEPIKEIPPRDEDKPVKEADSYNRYIAEGCKTFSGCNGPIDCVDIETDTSSWATTCEYRERYACFKEDYNRCEKQADTGKCGWTQSEELLQCVEDADGSEMQ